MDEVKEDHLSGKNVAFVVGNADFMDKNKIPCRTKL